jgi:hypothetical protein
MHRADREILGEEIFKRIVQIVARAVSKDSAGHAISALI